MHTQALAEFRTTQSGSDHGSDSHVILCRNAEGVRWDTPNKKCKVFHNSAAVPQRSVFMKADR